MALSAEQRAALRGEPLETLAGNRTPADEAAAWERAVEESADRWALAAQLEKLGERSRAIRLREENDPKVVGPLLAEAASLVNGDGSETKETTPEVSFRTQGSSYAERNEELPFRALDEALESAPEGPDWIWNGYVAPGAITLVAGRPKVGKSTLVFGLCGVTAEGHPFLGLSTRQCGVLLLSEEREDTLAEKQRRFGLGGSIDLLMRQDARGWAWPDIVAKAVAHCEERGLGIIIVDTWDKWAGLQGDQENSSGSVNEALLPLMDAASRELAVVIVTHQRKSSGSHGDAVRGSNALTGGVDVVVELERVSGDIDPAARVLRAESRYSDTPDELVARLVEAGYEACGDVAALRNVAGRQRIRAVLADAEEGFTSDELGEALGLPRATVHKCATEMHEEGELNRGGTGKRGDPYRWFLSARTDSYVRKETEVEQDEFPVIPLASADEEAETERLREKFGDAA